MRAPLGGFTTRGKSFLAAGITVAALGVGLGERALLSIGIAVLVLPLFAALATGRARYRIRCLRKITPTRVPAGQHATVSLRLENISRLPTGLLLAEDTVPYPLGTRPRFVLERIEQGGARELSYPIQSSSRGRFTVGPLRVRVADAFGLVELGHSFAEHSVLVVTPAITALPRTALAGSWHGEGSGRTRTAATAGEDDVVPRGYRDGDELRKVHWRSTARHGELMVRREEQRWRNRAVLLLDTRASAHAGTGPGSSFEFAVSAVASIGVHLTQAGLDGHLITDRGTASAPGRFEDILLDSLAVIKTSRGTELTHGMDGMHGPAGGLLVVVAGRLSPAQARKLAASRRDTGTAMALLLAVPTWAAAQPAHAQPAHAQPAHVPAAQGTLAEADGAAAILRAAGWRAVTVTADTPLGVAWERLQHTADLPASGPACAGRRDAAMKYRLTVTAAIATALASISLYSLVSGALWFWMGAGAAAVVGAVGALTRRRPLPPLVAALASLAGLLVYLTVLFAGSEALARVVPTGSSLHHLWSLVGQGIADSAKYTPPAPARHGILLLTVAGIGIVAVAVDLLAVRLRRPASAGLPLLVLFCVPLTTSGPRGTVGATVSFCLGMTGYLALLAADGRERLRVWGRLVTLRQSRGDDMARPASGPNTGELAASGRRIGLAAVTLALCVPLLVPGLRDHKLQFVGGDGTGVGQGIGSGGSLPSPLAQMNDDLHRSTASDVLVLRTAVAEPEYLQVYVLGTLTATSWTLAPWTASPLRGGRLPAAPGTNSGMATTTQRTRITLATGLTGSQYAGNFLPLPYPAQTVGIAGNWLTDKRTLMTYSPNSSLSGLSYSVTSKEPAPTAQQLQQSPAPPAAIARDDLPVPASFTRLTKLARQITRGQTSSYGRAVALQRWFTTGGRFTYSLNVSQLNSSSALIQFLTTTRRGYCQQFAFAMAVLARLVGIPSRVAIGYTPGTYLGKGRWQVKTTDAHAWPELYFQGAGWLRFEPTPAGTGGQDTAFEPAYTYPLLPVTPGSATASPTAAAGVPSSKASQAGGSHGAKLQELGSGSTTGGKHHSSSSPVGAVLAAALGLALITPWSARSLTRRRRWLSAGDDSRQADAAWHELLDDLADHRIASPASESPRALAARIAATLRLDPTESAALLRIARAEERALYAREPAASGTLRADVAVVRRAVSRMVSRPARWYARLLPASTLAPAGAALQHALDVFGWMDRVTVRRQPWQPPS